MKVVAAVIALTLIGGTALATPYAAPAPAPVAKGPTQIAFAVSPADVVIFLDGKRLGTAERVEKVATKPGRRVVRLERKGDATEMQVVIERGKTLSFAYDFGE